jgi:undecaprenyl diphosphate synthase
MAKDEDIHKKEVRVNIVGRKDIFPQNLRSRIDNLEEVTGDYDKNRVYICLGYDGRTEIVDAVNSLLNERINHVDEGALRNHMYSDMPDPDLVVRTGATSRLSGFLLWQTPYSELYFLDKLWPEFTYDDFESSLDFYKNSTRNFGR